MLTAWPSLHQPRESPALEKLVLKVAAWVLSLPQHWIFQVSIGDLSHLSTLWLFPVMGQLSPS